MKLGSARRGGPVVAGLSLGIRNGSAELASEWHARRATVEGRACMHVCVRRAGCCG